MLRLLTIALFLTVFAFGAAFSAVNNELITINYYFSTVTIPVSALVIISVIIGITIGASVLFASTLHLRYENRRLNKKLTLTQQEVDSLRILPLKDSH